MSAFSNLKMYWRFITDLPPFLRRTVSLEESRAIIQERLASRENTFLRLLERGIFENPKSPYLPLFRQAGCDLGDVRTTLRRKGLEGTLVDLREAGVYVSFEEFKCRVPIIRNGSEITVRAEDFDNPNLRKWYFTESGGSTGAGTRVPMDLDFIADLAPNFMLAHHTHGVLGYPTAIWRGQLPDGSGICNLLRSAMMDHMPLKWFSPLTGAATTTSVKNRIATRYILTMGRLMGVPFPSPEHVGLHDAIHIAKWAATMVNREGGCLLRCHVSLALRISLAAQQEGVDLTGTTFMGGGEPPSPAKVKEIRASGAHWIPIYYISETGPVGIGCLNPEDGNDLHVFKDLLALIQYPRRVTFSDAWVDSFHFTSLLPSAPKIMLNVESDDYGIVTKRSCGCPLESYGLLEHIGHVQSFSKLTGEGVTLVASEMTHILEEILPARFGGSALDYQLSEEEDARGFTRLVLFVNPEIQIHDHRVVIEAILDSIGNSSVAGSLAGTLWNAAGTFIVRREAPVWTSRGKLMPLRKGSKTK